MKIFRLNETALAIRPQSIVLETSETLGWQSLHVSVVGGEPPESPIVQRTVPDLWLAMGIDPIEIEGAIDGREVHLNEPAGRVSVVAPATPFRVRRLNNASVLHAFIRRRILADVAAEMFERDIDSYEIVSRFGINDPSLAFLLYSLKAALNQPACDSTELKIEYLSRALAVHVLQENTNLTRERPIPSTPLTPRSAELLADYIRTHLSEKLALDDLAVLAGLNRTNLIRQFKASFRQTPHQYVINARVDLAKELLEKSNLPVAEVAVTCGFKERTHLAAAFKRLMGVTPSRYRRLTQR